MLRSLALAGAAVLVAAKEPLTLVADNTTAVPSDANGAKFDFFSAPMAAGNFISFAGAGGAKPGCHFNCDTTNAVFVQDMGGNGDLEVLVRSAPGGDAMPSGAAVNETGDVALCADGSGVFFAASTADVAAGNDVGTLLFAPAAGPDGEAGADRVFEAAVSIGDAAPGDAAGKFIGFDPGSVSVAGTVATGVNMVFSGVTSAGIMGLFRATRLASSSRRALDESGGSSWKLTTIVDNSTAMPDLDGSSEFKELGTKPRLFASFL